MGSAALNEGGGPPVIGDFDSDGFPEIGVAGASRFRVFDLGCRGGGMGCEAPFVRWSKPSQDASSRQTGASVFDFDGDGKAEAVYADECFLRIYSGTNGEVLYLDPAHLRDLVRKPGHRRRGPGRPRRDRGEQRLPQRLPDQRHGGHTVRRSHPPRRPLHDHRGLRAGDHLHGRVLPVHRRSTV